MAFEDSPLPGPGTAASWSCRGRCGLRPLGCDADRPDEAQELAGDGSNHLRGGFAPREEAPIATTQTLLRFPGQVGDGVRLPALALPQPLCEIGREAVRPRGLQEHPAQMRVAGLGDPPAVDGPPARMLRRDGAAIAHELARMG